MQNRLFTHPTQSPADTAKKLFAEFNQKKQKICADNEKLEKEYRQTTAEKLQAEALVKELMVKEHQLRKHLDTSYKTSCDEIKDLFAAKIKELASQEVPDDLIIHSCTHDLGCDKMFLEVQTSDKLFSVDDFLERTILNPHLVGGTSHELTNSGMIQKVTLRNLPYNTDQDVYQVILEALTGVELSAEESLEPQQPPSPSNSRL